MYKFPTALKLWFCIVVSQGVGVGAVASQPVLMADEIGRGTLIRLSQKKVLLLAR